MRKTNLFRISQSKFVYFSDKGLLESDGTFVKKREDAIIFSPTQS
jgi:hypothetical protein